MLPNKRMNECVNVCASATLNVKIHSCTLYKHTCAHKQTHVCVDMKYISMMLVVDIKYIILKLIIIIV